jgi:hypothetical protein
MELSRFQTIIEKFLPKLQKLIEFTNDKRKALTYLHKTMLNPLYSADGKWESASVNTTYVAADYVAMDSPVAPKNRDRVSASNGKLPKVAIERQLKESELHNLHLVELMSDGWKKVVKKFTDDGTFCAVGIDEANEYAFLNGLSNGLVLIPDANDKNGNALRLNFGYLDANTFFPEKAKTIYLPDFKRVIEKADLDGNTIIKIGISKTRFDELRQTREARELVANYEGRIYTDDTSLPVPSAQKFKDAFADDNNGITFEVIDRSVVIERNGKRKNVKPWNNDRIIFLCNEVVGSLVYTETAEQLYKSDKAQYAVVDTFKLVSIYHEINPVYMEVTKAQAMVAPIIEDVDQIYVLDLSSAQEVDASDEGDGATDENITVFGAQYSKEKVVAALNALGVTATTSQKDETIIKKVNALSAEDQAKLKEALK